MASDVLALRYRPKEFHQLVGQKLNSVILSKMVENDAVPQGLLFSGPSGTGKTTAARILAAKLNVDAEPVELDAASHGGVADIRTLLDSLKYGYVGSYRVLILDEAQSITKDGFNALLKTLEEPPAGTIFVLASTEPDRIPETIKSRLIEFEFRRVSSSDLSRYVLAICKREKFPLSAELIEKIGDISNGSVRRALMTLDQCRTAEIYDLDEFLSLTGNSDESAELLKIATLGNPEKTRNKLNEILRRISNPNLLSSQIVGCLRDFQVIRSGGKITVTGASYELRKELAYMLEPERVFEALKVLWKLKTEIKSFDDPKTNLELALALIEKIFTHGKFFPVDSEPVRRMTLDELKDIK